MSVSSQNTGNPIQTPEEEKGGRGWVGKEEGEKSVKTPIKPHQLGTAMIE